METQDTGRGEECSSIIPSEMGLKVSFLDQNTGLVSIKSMRRNETVGKNKDTRT